MVQNEEDLNTEQQEQPSKAGQVAKDIGKKGAQETGKLAKVAFKKAVMTLIKGFGIKFLIIGIAILFVIVILGSCVFVLELDAGARQDNDNRKCTICCI